MQLCTAHEWSQALPLITKRVVCTRCGLDTPISSMAHAPRCVVHYVDSNSGWKIEPTKEETK